MEDWLASSKNNANSQIGSDIQKILSGQHTWHGTSHARPTYCNVCREQLSGVTSHGFSCEVCKCKVHKRCVEKTIRNCKWTTLASVGKDIIEDKHGNILMPHQWMEGNLPVSAKCAVCEKTCGSVLRLQDWRCIWCRTTVHTACRPKHPIRCPLGPNHVSVVPPTAIHSIGIDDAWEAVRPHGCSPLLVFVNSKSGDNQGVKFLRRFRQVLNPAQVFDLITSGPTLGLRLFRHFDPFRVLVCSGDGSAGWVLSEIDRLNMQLQCEVGVLPLGTGNDLARVLGWGASCDDDTHLPQLLERYERASPKILDRWSIMVFEKSIKVGDGGKLTLNTNTCLVRETNLVSTAVAYEDSVLSHLTSILESDQHSVVISSAKVLCETITDFISKISVLTLKQGDNDFSEKCQLLKTKLHHLLKVLEAEQNQTSLASQKPMTNSSSTVSSQSDEKFVNDCQEKESVGSKLDVPNPLRKDQLLLRVNSLKRAVRRVVEHTEKAVDEQTFMTSLFPSSPSARSINSSTLSFPKESTQQLSPVSPQSLIPNVTSISPLPDIRRGSSCSAEITLESLPVPQEFADPRHESVAEIHEKKIKPIFTFNQCETYHSESNATSVEVHEHVYDGKVDKGEGESAYDNQEEEEDEYNVEDHDDFSFGQQYGIYEEEQATEQEYVGSLSEELANICHIGSSETSDDSPEGSTNTKKESVSKNGEVNRSSLRDSTKESEHSFPISIDGVCNLGSELDDTNLFSTSPEEEDEFSEEYKREMGLESRKRCSIAHFIEGSDIARKSIKCRHGRTSSVDLDIECTAVKTENKGSSDIEQKTQSNSSILEIPKIRVSIDDKCKDAINLQISGSHRNLASSTDGIFLGSQDFKPDRRSYTLSETDDEEYVGFRRLSKAETMANSGSTGPTVIVDPPSPPNPADDEEATESEPKPQNETVRRLSESCRRLSAASPLMSLHCSPSPTRRISTISIASPSDASISSGGGKHTQKTLPIINPLVRLPQWPNVTETGIVGKVLLANADALCAAAVPLMDPDDVLMEGFYERCVMNNYFGIGIDAKISLDFHHKREEHPEKCRSRTRNYMWYGVLGSKQWLQKTCKNLEQRVQLECDGQRIPLPSLQGIVVLNIPSFMGGINFWGGTKEDDVFLAPSIDDHILEVVAVFGTVQMAASRLINLQHHRIAQCSTIQINILGDEGVPIQVDGEAWIQPPGIIRIIHKNRVKMLCRNKTLESSLRAWEERQRQKRSESRMNSNAGRLTPLGEEELNMLLAFIEATTTLVKFVKMLIIRHPSIEADLLYTLAATVGTNLERVHPSGKILKGLELRPAVTELTLSAQRLMDETNALLHDKNLQIAPEFEKQLHSAMLQMEIELKKCKFVGPPQNSLVHFRAPSPDEQDRKIRQRRRSSGQFWQKLRGSGGFQSSRVPYTARDVSDWDLADVGLWLDSIQMGEYAGSFAANAITGAELAGLTREDLTELGVFKLGHAKRLRNAIIAITR